MSSSFCAYMHWHAAEHMLQHLQNWHWQYFCMMQHSLHPLSSVSTLYVSTYFLLDYFQFYEWNSLKTESIWKRSIKLDRRHWFLPNTFLTSCAGPYFPESKCLIIRLLFIDTFQNIILICISYIIHNTDLINITPYIWKCLVICSFYFLCYW